MTEEERGLFTELQDEIGELKRLFAATDGTTESKVDITDLFIIILQSRSNSPHNSSQWKYATLIYYLYLLLLVFHHPLTLLFQA